MTTINIAVVPVAGLGTRLLPATKSQPKEMLPVGRKPVVQSVVDATHAFAGRPGYDDDFTLVIVRRRGTAPPGRAE